MNVIFKCGCIVTFTENSNTIDLCPIQRINLYGWEIQWMVARAIEIYKGCKSIEFPVTEVSNV